MSKALVRYSAALAISGALLSLAAPASAANGTNPKAITFGAAWLKPVLGAPAANATMVGCNAGAMPHCNAYNGETPETTSLAILCFVPGSAAPPAGYNTYYQTHFTPGAQAVDNWKYYSNWSGGQIGLTSQIAGTTITSQAVADNICKGPQGLSDPNARMLEFHDNGVGGWNVSGNIHPNSKTPHLLKNNANARRFWVRITDQPSNLWN